MIMDFAETEWLKFKRKIKNKFYNSIKNINIKQKESRYNFLE